MWWWWLACASGPVPPDASSTGGGGSNSPLPSGDSAAPTPDPTGTGPSTSADTATPPSALPWSEDACAGLWADTSYYQPLFARWEVDDPPPGQWVAVGSSTIRRWEGGAWALRAQGLVQRGFGGAKVREVAQEVDRLILAHEPAGVLVFAGTNDLADGRSVAEVVLDTRCLLQRLFQARPELPVVIASITPTPARWSIWAQADQVNRELATWLAQRPEWAMADTSDVFLAGAAPGQPPDAAYFVSDGLHLSEEGYRLWESVVLPTVSALGPPRPAPVGGPPPGTRVRLDLGPANPEDGWLAPAVDGLGISWNAWSGAIGGDQVVAGEARRGLVGTEGQATTVEVVVAGGFRANGLRNGGLVAPDGGLLGTLALPEATGDFFYYEDADDPAGLLLGGLDPTRRHTLRLFASRASADEVRSTRFVAHGADDPVEGVLVTTGAGVGAGGYDGNNDEVLVLSGLRPSPWGQIWLDVRREEGQFAYLSLLELEVEP